MSCTPHLGARHVAASTHKTATNETQKTKRTHLAQCFQHRLSKTNPERTRSRYPLAQDRGGLLPCATLSLSCAPSRSCSFSRRPPWLPRRPLTIAMAASSLSSPKETN